MEPIKADIISINGKYEPVWYTGKRWRLFCTPYSFDKEMTKPFTTIPDARRAAETVAAELGKTLNWEGSVK